MAIEFGLNLCRRGDVEEHTIRHYPLGSAVFADARGLAIDDMRAFIAAGKKKGYTLMFPGIAKAIGAHLAISNKVNGQKWRAEIDAKTDWLHGTDTGISSVTIHFVMTGIDGGAGEYGTPIDPEDFGRCHRLLKLHPEWIPRLPEVAARFPKWTRLVEAWPTLTELYERDLPTGQSDELYKLMRVLGSSTG